MKITLGDQTVLLAGSSLIAVVLFVWGLGPSCGTVGSWLGALRLCFSGGPFLLAFLGLFHQQCHATLCLSDFWLKSLGVKEAPNGCWVVSLYQVLEVS